MVYTQSHVIVASHNISNLMNQMRSVKLLLYQVVNLVKQFTIINLAKLDPHYNSYKCTF